MRWLFFAGLGVGVAGGILFAPMRGVQVRRRLARRSRDLAGRASESFDTTLRRTEQTVDEARITASEWRDSAREAKPRRSSLLDFANTATEEDLISINGIGKVLASRIIKGRPYDSEQALADNKVVPPSVINAMRDHLLDRRGA